MEMLFLHCNTYTDGGMVMDFIERDDVSSKLTTLLVSGVCQLISVTIPSLMQWFTQLHHG